MDKETIKKVMIILSIIIVMIIITLIILVVVTKKQDKEQSIVNEEETQKIVTDEDRIEQYDFLVVSNCVSAYLSGINQNNSSYYGRDENNNDTIIVSQEQMNRNAYNLLSSEYIQRNAIIVDKVYQYVPEVKQDFLFVPIDMKLKKGENVNQYKVYGYASDLKYNFVSDIFVIVNLDINNKTFSIEPIKEEEYGEENFKNNDVEIEANDNNKYVYKQLSEEYRLKQYFQNYKIMLLSNVEIAYKFLDNDYKEKCFGDLEEFKKFIARNRDKLIMATLDEYDAKENGNYREYVEKDKRGNYYIFNISNENPTDYKVMLDTYVIGFEKLKEEYHTRKEEDKVEWNIMRFISAINDKKYYYVYQILADSFKNENFASQEEFEVYVKNNFFENNVIEEGNLDKESGYYMYHLIISDGQENRKEMTIVMQLQEDDEFVMSFSFNE